MNNSQTHGKDTRYVVTRGRGWREGELEEGDQKVQNYIYNINKY